MAKKHKREVPERLGNWGLTRNYINNMLSVWPVRSATQAADLGKLEQAVEDPHG